jgi:TonB family protein
MFIGCSSCGLLLAGLVLIASPQSPLPQSTEPPWPPSGVYRSGPGVVPPRLVSETKPRYTPQAMRARIEGVVTLDCIVGVDGSVTAVRVSRSLDGEYGLDQSAMEAVKQWRFTPGTKDGVAVPVMVRIEMTFSIAGSSRVPEIASASPVFEWPAAFASMPAAEGWSERDVAVADLQIRIALPRGWDPHTDDQPNRVFLAHDATAARAFVVARPQPTTMRIEQPLPPARLQLATESLKAKAGPPGSEITSVGQVRAGGRLWLWVEARLLSLDAVRAAMPPEIADQMEFDSGRLWIFSTTAGSQFVQITSMLLYPRGLTPQEIEERTRQAGADFVRIVERFSITPR